MIKSCRRCSKEFESDASTAMYCSKSCRQAASRAKKTTVALPTASSGSVENSVSTVATVTRQLEMTGRLDTYLGAAAVQLAQRIDASTAVMGFAALVKELRSTMDAALEGVQVADDPLDELRARRDRKLTG